MVAGLVPSLLQFKAKCIILFLLLPVELMV